MCECKELVDKALCDKGFIWNLSNCECECDKSCDIGEYLDYSNCKCRKKLVYTLIEKCTKNIKETRLIEKSLVKNERKYSSCTLCIALFWIFFIFSVTNIGVGTYLTYYKYMSRIKENVPKYDYKPSY